MKFLKIFLVLGVALGLFSCDRDLPYDLDGVIHGVIVDINRAPGTDRIINNGSTDGDYKVRLVIPKQQGDYSMLKEAQLLCVYTDQLGVTTAKVVKEGITTFPQDVTVDMADVCQVFGIASPTTGERFEFTVNTVLKSGVTIEGWTPQIGYNNRRFTGWTMETGNGYSYRVGYSVPAPLNMAIFQGSATCFEEGSPYPCTVTQLDMSNPANLPLPADIPEYNDPADLQGLEITPIWDDGLTLRLWVNKRSLEIIIPNESYAGEWTWVPGTAPLYFNDSVGEVDTNNDSLVFETTITWAAPYAWRTGYVIRF